MGSGSRSLKAWAAELGCSVDTLRRAIKRRELLATREPTAKGRGYVVSAADMSAFLEKRRTA